MIRSGQVSIKKLWVKNIRTKILQANKYVRTERLKSFTMAETILLVAHHLEKEYTRQKINCTINYRI